MTVSVAKPPANSPAVMPLHKHDPACRLIVIEGIPGAGKTTLHERLVSSFGTRHVYSFSEESLLFGWQHFWLPGIDALRRQMMSNLLDYVDQVLSSDADTIFVLTRFHMSYALHTGDSASEFYARVINRLTAHAAHVYVPVVPREQIEQRAFHVERISSVWRMYLEKRQLSAGAANLTELFSMHQEQLLHLLKEQGLPYSLLPPVDSGQGAHMPVV